MSNVTRVRMAADYECHPVWVRGADGALENVAPTTLAIATDLVDALRRWAEVFDQTLNQSDPISSGFSTALEHELFVRWGHSLGLRLAAALDEDVEYFDDLAQEAVVLNPGGS